MLLPEAIVCQIKSPLLGIGFSSSSHGQRCPGDPFRQVQAIATILVIHNNLIVKALLLKTPHTLII